MQRNDIYDYNTRSDEGFAETQYDYDYSLACQPVKGLSDSATGFYIAIFMLAFFSLSISEWLGLTNVLGKKHHKSKRHFIPSQDDLLKAPLVRRHGSKPAKVSRNELISLLEADNEENQALDSIAAFYDSEPETKTSAPQSTIAKLHTIMTDTIKIIKPRKNAQFQKRVKEENNNNNQQTVTNNNSATQLDLTTLDLPKDVDYYNINEHSYIFISPRLWDYANKKAKKLPQMKEQLLALSQSYQNRDSKESGMFADVVINDSGFNDLPSGSTVKGRVQGNARFIGHTVAKKGKSSVYEWWGYKPKHDSAQCFIFTSKGMQEENISGQTSKSKKTVKNA